MADLAFKLNSLSIERVTKLNFVYLCYLLREHYIDYFILFNFSLHSIRPYKL